jgi:hypothetical protein
MGSEFVTAPRHTPAREAARSVVDEAGRESPLLIEQFLPSYDFAVVHARVFRAPPEACYPAARGLDLLGDPVIRTLLGLRSLPQRVADRLARQAEPSTRRTPRTSGWRT